MTFRRGHIWTRAPGWTASLLVIGFLGCLAASEEPPGKVTRAFAIKQRVFPSGRHVDKAAFGALSAKERELLIWYLWNLDDTVELAILGDSNAREKVVAEFLNASQWGRGGSELKALRDPKVIPMIGEALFKEEKFEQEEGSDVGFAPIQETVRGATVHILGNSPEFNERVINWARRMRDDSSMNPEETAIMRDWYRANEAKLKAGDFKAVQPGAEPPERNASASVDRPPSSVPGISSPNFKPISSPGSTQTQDSAGNVYAWIAAFLLAASGGVVWLLKHKRS